MKFLFVLICLFFIGAQSAPAKKIDNFFGNKTKIENPFKLRDPFKAPIGKSDGGEKRKGFTLSGKGQYTNIAEIPLGQINLNELKVVGVLIGKERRAMINPGKDGQDGNRIIIVKEGMKLGPEGAELKAILPGGIILVEKIVNVYGEEEYLETVVPISK